MTDTRQVMNLKSVLLAVAVGTTGTAAIGAVTEALTWNRGAPTEGAPDITTPVEDTPILPARVLPVDPPSVG